MLMLMRFGVFFSSLSFIECSPFCIFLVNNPHGQLRQGNRSLISPFLAFINPKSQIKSEVIVAQMIYGFQYLVGLALDRQLMSCASQNSCSPNLSSSSNEQSESGSVKQPQELSWMGELIECQYNSDRCRFFQVAHKLFVFQL